MVQSYISHSISNTLHYSSEIHPYMGEFLYIYGTNIGICNSGVGKMKHPAFIFVLTKKEVLMVSVELKQEKHNALVSFLMIVIAALFLLYMGSSLVHSTKAFWENYSIEELLE